MSGSNFRAAYLDATQTGNTSFKKPSIRRTSALSFKAPLKDSFSEKNSSSFQLRKECAKGGKSLQNFQPRKPAAQSNESPSLQHAVPPKDSQSMSQNQGTSSLRKSRLRVSKAWERPEEGKLLGLWQQYEEVWFGIHCETVSPLLEDFPLPTITKSLNDVSEHSIDKPETPPQKPATAENKKRGYRIRLVPNKLKEIDKDLVPCLHCKERKRKGMYLGCRHYFCRDCLRYQVQSHIEQMKVPMKCMVPDCRYELESPEIMKNVSNSENVMKYFDLIVADFVKRRPHLMIQCFTEGCKYVVDMTKMKQKNILKCPRCKVNYCIPCHKPFKRGHTCEDLNNCELHSHPADVRVAQSCSFQ